METARLYAISTFIMTFTALIASASHMLIFVAVAWGAFGKPHLAATAVLMWGVGDAVAALVGIPFGRHKVQLPGLA